jgi:hypothetical protein
MIKQNEQKRQTDTIRQSDTKQIRQIKPKDVLCEDIMKQIVSLYCCELKQKQIESERVWRNQ